MATPPSKNSGKSFAYDIMGNVSQTVECAADWCGDYTHDIFHYYGYDLAGNLVSERYAIQGWNGYGTVPSTASVNYGLNTAGQLTSMSAAQADGTNSPYIFSDTASTITPAGPTTRTLATASATAS